MVGRRRTTLFPGAMNHGRIAWWTACSEWFQTARGEATAISLARMASSAGGILVALATARHLGPQGRGEIVFVVTVAMLASELVSLGTNVSGRIRILRSDSVRIDDYLGLSLVLLVPQCVLMAVVLQMVGVEHVGLGPGSVAWGVLLGVTMLFALMMLDAAFAIRRTLATTWRDLAIGGVPMAGVAILAILGRLDPAGTIALTALGYAFGGAYLYRVVVGVAGRPRIVPVRWRTIIRSGILVLGGTFGQTIAFRADRMILGVAVSTGALGLYSVAATAVELPRVLLVSFLQVLSNRLATGELRSSDLARVVIRVGIAHVVLLTAIGLYGAPVVTAAVGRGFQPIADLVGVMALGEGFLAVYFVGIAIATGLGRFDLLPAPAMSGAVVMVVLDLLIIPHGQSSGAAWVRSAAFGVMAVVGCVQAARALSRTLPT